MAKRRQKESLILNRRVYNTIFDYLMSLAVTMFEYTNLPNTVDAIFLERTLTTGAFALFFEDPILGYQSLPCTIGGQWNNYNVPKQRMAYASNNYHMERDDTNSVLIYNNLLRQSSLPVIEFYTRKLTEIDRTIWVNIKQQKTPKIIRTTENQRLTMQNLFEEYDGNVPFIFADKAMNLEGLEVLDNLSPYVSDKLMVLYQQYFNAFLTYMGIENANTSKRERLVEDEIVSGLGNVEACRYIRLEARHQAVDKINEMFGLNISVEYRTTYLALDTAKQQYDLMDVAKSEGTSSSDMVQGKKSLKPIADQV